MTKQQSLFQLPKYIRTPGSRSQGPLAEAYSSGRARILLAERLNMTSTKPTVVLVPGACHFPKCFDILVARLAQQGYPIEAISLRSNLHPGQTPATSHHQDAAIVRESVEALIEQGKNIIVFAHSYGGIPVSEGLAGLSDQAATRNVKLHIIFCNAFVLSEGHTIASFFDRPELKPFDNSWVTFEENYTVARVVRENAIERLYADVEPAVAEKAIGDLALGSVQAWGTTAEKCAFREFPCTWIMSRDDRIVWSSVQRWITQQVGIEDIVEIEGSHSPFLSRPDEVVAIVDRASQGI